MSKFSSLYAIPSKNGLTKPRAIRGEGIKFINMGELFQSHRIGDIQTERVPVTEKELREALLQEGDLLFARQSLVREGAGKCSVVTEVSEPTTSDSHLIRVRLDRKVANPYFFQYYFSSALSPIPGIVSQCAQAGIKGTDLGNLDVFCPNLDLQNRIVDVLEAYDKLIENNRRQIALLEEAAQRLYKEWFVDLRFPGYEEMSINPETGLPREWRKGVIGEIADYISRGVTPKYNEESSWRVLGQTCVRGNLVLLEKSRRLDPIKSPDKVLRRGDLLINSTGVGSLGRTAQVWFDPDRLTADSHITIVRDSTGIYSNYIAQWAFGNERYIESLQTGSTGQTELSKDRVKSIPIIIPNVEKVEQFNRASTAITEAIIARQEGNALLIEARDRLLPKLMSGEIEVV